MRQASLIPLILPVLLLLGACKPQDPAPLPPQVGTRSTPPAVASPAPAADQAIADGADAPDPDADSDLVAGTDEGRAAAPDADASAAVASIDGVAIYRSACSTCHATGLAGAPKPGDSADWGPRIAQGEQLMLDRAIKGYTGKKGFMPPKGGFMHLSEDEIRAAIAHMTSAAP